MGMFNKKNFAIYVLDDYAVHLQSEVRAALLKRGYILIIIGGGVTGDIQVLRAQLIIHLSIKEFCHNRHISLFLIAY